MLHETIFKQDFFAYVDDNRNSNNNSNSPTTTTATADGFTNWIGGKWELVTSRLNLIPTFFIFFHSWIQIAANALTIPNSTEELFFNLSFLFKMNMFWHFYSVYLGYRLNLGKSRDMVLFGSLLIWAIFFGAAMAVTKISSHWQIKLSLSKNTNYHNCLLYAQLY